MLITPKAAVTPQLPRNVAMRSPTVVACGSDMLRLPAGDVERRARNKRRQRRCQEDQGLRCFLRLADTAQRDAAGESDPRASAGNDRDTVLETVLHQATVVLRRDITGAGMGAPIIAE